MPNSNYLGKFFRTEGYGWTDGVISERDVTALPAQSVTVDGAVAGFQFSRTTMGQRTVRRLVSNLRRDGDDIFGTVEFYGRVLDVKWTGWRWQATSYQ
jgi:hypothetical protein